jgi:hypothetical protein
VALLEWICARASNERRQEVQGVLAAMTDGRRVNLSFDSYDWADNGDWDAPPDDRNMTLYDASFKLTA